LSLGVLRDLKNCAITLYEEGNVAEEIVGRVIFTPWTTEFNLAGLTIALCRFWVFISASRTTTAVYQDFRLWAPAVPVQER
jgi:hypothetical protein